MHAIDLVVVGVYIAGVVWMGRRVSGAQRGPRDYFLTDRRVPWWALLGSIVATETSTVTLISVPGFAFTGDLTFLQLAAGYVVGRIVVAAFFVPAYLHGRVLTAYELLTERFGAAARHVTAGLFLGTRSLSDGFRLFATGLVIAAALDTLPMAGDAASVVLPGLTGPTALLILAIAMISLATLAYTLLGGMNAVIWTDVVQLVVYLGGAVLTAAILLQHIPGGWGEVLTASRAAGKLRLLDLSVDLTRSYTFWSGVVGGLFITAATHGADQLFVQRYLCSRSTRDAQRALIVSGAVIVVQFTLFLAIGLMLWVYYTGYDPEGLRLITVDGQVQPDRILPTFMMSHLPVGIRGLVLAAIVAAAMSTLSSSLNSSAASTVGDFYVPLTRGSMSDSHYLWVSRMSTAGWALVQGLVALIAIGLSQRVVDEVLGVQSFTGGLILGVITLALITRGTTTGMAPIAGVVCGGLTLLYLRLQTDVSWQWYAVTGALTTVIVGTLIAGAGSRGRPQGGPS